jgi:hypothetical protein
MTERLIITGVGSRETPRSMGAIITDFAEAFARSGAKGRSGAAVGADSDFEEGFKRVKGDIEVYLAWRGASGHPSQLFGVCARAFAMAKTVHPRWEILSDAAKKLHGRNVYQVLGKTLDIPSDALVCWTPDGMEKEKERTGKSGGTATAIVLACRNDVPVFNLARAGSLNRLVEFMLEKGVTPPAHRETPQLSQAGLF